MTGICYSYFKHRKEEALAMLLEVKSENAGFNEVNFYLGRAYAVNNRFDDAIAVYQEYLTAEGVEDSRKAEARQHIIYCENAKVYLQDSLEVEITNIGSPINTDHSEYVPVITPDESMMIFTYSGERSKGGLLGPTGKPDPDGHYYEDVMISYKLGDDWLEPESIADNVNDAGHNASIALSVDGQMLFVYKQSKADQGDIYVSSLVGDEWSKPERLKGEINSEFWEGSATLTSDGQTIYFSSEREGGFGGRDLYSASLQADESWGDIQNLGPVINTRFDDDAPFIHPDRRTMYFSSKGHKELKKLRENELSSSQLKKAKQQIIGQITLSEENNCNVMLGMGKSILLYNKIDDLSETFSKIEKISAKNLINVANHIFDKNQLSSLIFTPN